MSLINQALKKTQSLLHKQKERSIPLSDSASEPVIQTASIPPFSQLKNPFYRKSAALNKYYKYWRIGIASAIFIAYVGFEIATHFPFIEKRYMDFYEKLFSDVVVKKKPVIVTPVIITPVFVNTAAPIASLSLEGTMKTNHTRVAMINGNLYTTGEIISGYKIIQIRYNHIVLQNIATHHMHTLSPALVH